MLPETIITKGTIADLSQIYPSFNEEFINENKDMDYLEKLMENKKYLLLFMKNRQTHENIGYAFVFQSINNKFLWIDYIATFPEYRNKGFGNAFMEKIISKFKENTLGIFYEIDRHFDTTQEKISIDKRINFYKRFNAKKLDVDYCFESDGKIVEMDLYFIPVKSINSIDGSLLKDCLIEFFDYFYDHKTRKTLDFPYNTTIKTQKFG